MMQLPMYYWLKRAVPGLFVATLLLLGTPGNTQAATFQVSYSNSAFNPSTVTIRPGDTVNWTNAGSSSIQIASDPHPIHTNYQPLNLGIINSGAAKSLTFPTAGSYGYHNHLNPGATGRVVVTSVTTPSPSPSASPRPSPSPTATPRPTASPSPSPLVSPSPSLNDLVLLLLRYLSTADSDLFVVDGKVNMLDAGFLIQRLAR